MGTTASFFILPDSFFRFVLRLSFDTIIRAGEILSSSGSGYENDCLLGCWPVLSHFLRDHTARQLRTATSSVPLQFTQRLKVKWVHLRPSCLRNSLLPASVYLASALHSSDLCSARKVSVYPTGRHSSSRQANSIVFGGVLLPAAHNLHTAERRYLDLGIEHSMVRARCANLSLGTLPCKKPSNAAVVVLL